MINERLSKIINLRLKSSLEKCVFYPYGSEIWIFDEEELNWLIILNSEGQLSYNKKFFNELFACFSFRDREYQPYLKLWIEKLFRIPIRSLRRTSGMDYLVESMFNDKKKNKIWEINKRFEFGFEIVKRYLELKKINDKVHLELFMS